MRVRWSVRRPARAAPQDAWEYVVPSQFDAWSWRAIRTRASIRIVAHVRRQHAARIGLPIAQIRAAGAWRSGGVGRNFPPPAPENITTLVPPPPRYQPV